jgi:nucleoid DNA-binding protein
MQQLIKKIADHAGIEEETAKKALEAILAHVREKFPIVRAVVESMVRAKQPAKAQTNNNNQFFIPSIS